MTDRRTFLSSMLGATVALPTFRPTAVRHLILLDMDVQIRVGPRPEWKQSASVTVEHVTRF